MDSRKYSALEGYGNQYWQIHSSILAWRKPLTEKPGRLQSTVSSCDPRVSAAASLSGTLVVPSVQGHGLSPPQELYIALSESFFKLLVAGDQKASLASLSP